MDRLVASLAMIMAIGICSIVLCCTKWLLDREREFPREEFPVTDDDQWRGVRCGASVGVLWLLVDLVLHGYWQKPLWSLFAWEIRLTMFTALTLAGCFTLGEVFRVIRCRKHTPSHVTEDN